MIKKIVIYGIIAIISCVSMMHGTAAGLTEIDEESDICMVDVSMLSSEKTCNLTRDHIDIAKINRMFPDEGNVTLILILNGELMEDANVRYVMWFNTSYGKVLLDYSNGENNGYTYHFNTSDEHVPPIADPEILNGNSIKVTYPLLESDFTDEKIEARAMEMNGSLKWFDNVPSVKKDPFDDPEPIDFENPYGDNGTGNTSSTPGFSTGIVLVTGCILCLFLWVRRRFQK